MSKLVESTDSAIKLLDIVIRDTNYVLENKDTKPVIVDLINNDWDGYVSSMSQLNALAEKAKAELVSLTQGENRVQGCIS
jgi:hypothetical protein